jgi:hypothetical protein
VELPSLMVYIENPADPGKGCWMASDMPAICNGGVCVLVDVIFAAVSGLRSGNSVLNISANIDNDLYSFNSTKFV